MLPPHSGSAALRQMSSIHKKEILRVIFISMLLLSHSAEQNVLYYNCIK